MPGIQFRQRVGRPHDVLRAGHEDVQGVGDENRAGAQRPGRRLDGMGGPGPAMPVAQSQHGREHQEQHHHRERLRCDEELRRAQQAEQQARAPDRPAPPPEDVDQDPERQRRDRREDQELVGQPLAHRERRETIEQAGRERRRPPAHQPPHDDEHRERGEREPGPEHQVVGRDRAGQDGDRCREDPQQRHRGVVGQVDARRVEDPVRVEQRVPVKQRERHPAEEPHLLGGVTARADLCVRAVQRERRQVGGDGDARVDQGHPCWHQPPPANLAVPRRARPRGRDRSGGVPGAARRIGGQARQSFPAEATPGRHP